METENIEQDMCCEKSLNRTMQYGNAGSQYIHFKYISFKSYYVVWKPKNPKILGTTISMFKSYYVVWKPFFFRKKSNMVISLNRTMQYGNLFDI